MEDLLADELPKDYTGIPHHLLPAFPPLNLSLNSAEAKRVAAKQPSTAIDVSRYESLEVPTTTRPTSSEIDFELLEAWKTTLQNAYASSTHLHSRLQNLALLGQFGKNAWLFGNAQLENILQKIEKELIEIKEQSEELNGTRQLTQEGIKGEMDGLNEGWKKSIGRLIEVQLAAEQVKGDILASQREGAV